MASLLPEKRATPVHVGPVSNDSVEALSAEPARWRYLRVLRALQRYGWMKMLRADLVINRKLIPQQGFLCPPVRCFNKRKIPGFVFVAEKPKYPVCFSLGCCGNEVW